ncbi:MAG: D-alanyl-D-alanine carboxypeptidase [Ruminococcaceae bacterium]|nr:D-alanyl-D-alanine carboxypeptidase [Oscillospiraceae bacterium]
MSRNRKLLSVLLAWAILFSWVPLRIAAKDDTTPTVSAHSAILIEADSGDVVYEKNAHERLPMASTTKLMTALVAASCASSDTLIRVDARAVGVEGSSIYLTEGEVLSLETLLYALLLESANDAAAAIAIGLFGSVEAFADEMNRTALSLGLVNTHFVNPHGLDDENHYTTAYELSKIAQAVLENEWLRKIVSTERISVSSDEEERTRLFVNHNKLLRTYDGCIGMKTGFTKKSGRCLVSAAEKNGVCMISVTLNAPNDWQDHTALLDLGFSRYRSVTLVAPEAFKISLPVVGGSETLVWVSNADGLRITIPAQGITVDTTVELPRFLYAPITQNEPVGYLVFRADRDGNGEAEELGRVALTASNEVCAAQVKRKGLWQRIKAFFQRLFK